MTTCCTVLSPQEQRIQEEQLGIQDFGSRERVFKILNSFQEQLPRIDIERAKYFTGSTKIRISRERLSVM